MGALSKVRSQIALFLTTNLISRFLVKFRKVSINGLSAYKNFRQGNTIAKINGEDGNKIADLAHLLPMQLITPEGLTLLNGGPSFRRAFLDWGLFHHHNSFHSSWVALNRLLKQRKCRTQSKSALFCNKNMGY